MLFVKVQENFEPDDWLSFLMGTQSYFDISGNRFEGNCDLLISSVREFLGIPDPEKKLTLKKGENAFRFDSKRI